MPFAVNAQNAVIASTLATQSKTSILIEFSLPTPSIPSSGLLVNYIKLPFTAGYIGGDPVGMSCKRVINEDVLSIRSLSADVSASTGGGVSSNVTMVLATYSKTGIRGIMASQSLTTNGKIQLIGPFNLDHTQYEYIIECEIIAAPVRYPITRATATMNPVVMEYDK